MNIASSRRSVSQGAMQKTRCFLRCALVTERLEEARMNNIRDNRKEEIKIFRNRYGTEIDKDIFAQKDFHRFPLLGKIVR